MPDSSGATVFDDLPEWLIVDEILVRLRPKDVFRSRAVRKSWRSGTSTDRFILDHQRHQPSLPIVEHIQRGTHRLPVLGLPVPVPPVIKIYGASKGADTDALLVASCDGLVVMGRR